MSDKIAISFIIPAFNEADMIVDTLTQLHSFAPNVGYEVIIVDNGSTDNTIKLAQQFDDTVLSCPTGTIAAVRNCGVQASKGKVLVFLDADIKLTQQWKNNIDSALEYIDNEPMVITGSRYSPPENDNTLNNHWFNLLVANNSATYINSGHLVTSRILFDKISGFDEQLRTAEDYDFCERARHAGAIITPNTDLKVIHEGYPTTYFEFIKRERWHGREDFKTLTSLLKSKIALVICLHILILLSCIIMSLSTEVIDGIIVYLISITSLSVFLTIYKFKLNAGNSLIKTSFIHYLYIIGRTLSLIDRLTLRYSKRFR